MREPLPPLYASFLREFYRVSRSDDVAARAALFATFNEQITPLLPDEESFFQFLLYRLMHLYQATPNPRVRMHVTQDLQGAPVRRWAEENHLTQLTTAAGVGGLSMMLEPVDSASPYAAALCFRGTAASYRPDILACRAYAQGKRDDLHARGVGYGGFMHHRDTWLAQLRTQLAKGRDVLLVGHSLGACYAAELLIYAHAQLPPEHFKRLSLLSFAAPGLRRATLQALVPHRARIRVLEVPWDFFAWVGHGHPAGRIYTSPDTLGTSLSPLQYPHNIPQLAVRRLGGEKPRFHSHERVASNMPLLRPVEWLRRIVGLVAKRAFPY